MRQNLMTPVSRRLTLAAGPLGSATAGRRVAVRVVSQFGEESTKVLEVPTGEAEA